ncbi:hypothetical protein JZK55_13580 [Dissulfurispira thermophila]|uniref:histidine kinase n=1 Tax=Dissulfurispira thermophila TaxID=2715679 RepID=A0A7G1H3B9_9BACT|nr:ATP-binding protein [Dissulfurispira thermophila]BCB96436.1 hypothetical protein JZK55_13580 [Dissulfurispira thermophila]
MRRNLFNRLFIASACLAVLPVMLFTIISVYLQEKGIEPFGLKLFFMGFILLLIVFSFIVSYIFALKTEKPLKELVTAAERFSRGEFDYRVPDVDIEDFQIVTDSFNRMAKDINLLTKELDDAKNYFKQLYDSISNYVLIISPDKSIVEANEKFLEDTGLGRNDVIGKKCWQIVHSYDKECSEKGESCYLDDVYRDGIQRSVTHVHTLQGIKQIHNIVYTPFRDKNGNIQFVIEDIRDITDVAEMQERIRESEKMAAIGRLISGLAHEINNPLAIIGGYAQIASDIGLSDEERLRDACKKIFDASERINKLMKILMDFASVGTMPIHPISVNESLKNTLSILHREIKNNAVSVEIDLDAMEPFIMAREDIIKAFYNITANAIEAMADSDKRLLTVRSNIQGGNVVITISDTGKGVPVNMLNKLVEPFFTTKEFGRLGMGLSTAYSMIKNYGGDIDFVTNNGLSVIISFKRYGG